MASAPETQYAPVDLIRRTELVMRAGLLMLGAGTSSLRVDEVMRAVGRSLDLDTVSARISFNDIGLTTSKDGIYRTQVAQVPGPGVNADRIAAMQELVRDLPVPSAPDEVARRLGAIARRRPLYPTWLLTVMVALACASVTVLSNGGLREVLAVLPASALGFWVLRRLNRAKVNVLAGILAAAVVSCGGYVALAATLAHQFGPSPRLAAGFVCSAIFLIPGFPLVTGGLELVRLDLHAGIPRLVYAATVLLAITIGVWLLTTISGVQPALVPAPTGPFVLVWMARVAASFFAVLGWAMMFNSPLRSALASGLIAVVANVPRLVALDQQVPNHVATFWSCFLIGLLCALAGRQGNTEKIIMTVPTVLVSIPGSSALRSMIYFDRQDVLPAVGNLVATVMVVIAMVAGLSGARMLTDPEWAFTDRRWHVPHWLRR